MSVFDRVTYLNVTCRRVALLLPLIVAAASSDAHSTGPKRAAPRRASATIDPLTPTLLVTPNTLTFGPQPPNAVSAQQVVTVRNTGSVDVHLTTLSWDGGTFNVSTD